MKKLVPCFAYLILVASYCMSPRFVDSVSDFVFRKVSPQRELGYYFALKEVPLSTKKYIFIADPLKRAHYFNEGDTIPLSHTMTVKKAKGFDMYFSSTDYNIIVSIKTEEAIDKKTIEYTGNLYVQRDRKKNRFVVHGYNYR